MSQSSTPPRPAPNAHRPRSLDHDKAPQHAPQDERPRDGAVSRLHRWLLRDTTGGILLIAAALVAVAWANSPWRSTYFELTQTTIGPSAPFHLDLTLAAWAADGLLAIFFFIVGMELKHEFVAGSLRSPRQAAVPILAAIGGMAAPALIFLALVTTLGDPSAQHGWAIPTATDIAFALAILAVFGRGLPAAIRTFLLTLAVVDDLLAIIVIAVFYTTGLDLVFAALALGSVVAFGWLVRRRRISWWLLLPVALLAWGLMHESGIHATVAGVLLGLTVPAATMHGEAAARTSRYEHSLRPISSGVALPVFAFFAAGVSLVDNGGAAALLGQPVAISIIVGLVVGKLLGVLGTTAVLTRLTPFRLAPGIGVRDLLPVGLLAGIGFTVSLLIADLSFADGLHTGAAKAAILTASVIAASLAAITLRWDARRSRDRDMNRDGTPDNITEFIGDPNSSNGR